MTVTGVSIQIARPMGDDLGIVEEGYFVVNDDTVVLTDAEGKPLLRDHSRADVKLTWNARVSEGSDSKTEARRLLYARFVARRRGADFRRPMRYPQSGVA